MLTLHKLFILVLAFNHFPEVPPTVAQLTDVRISEVENVILAGNQIESLPAGVYLFQAFTHKQSVFSYRYEHIILGRNLFTSEGNLRGGLGSEPF